MFLSGDLSVIEDCVGDALCVLIDPEDDSGLAF
jgi:hypothetical protein